GHAVYRYVQLFVAHSLRAFDQCNAVGKALCGICQTLIQTQGGRLWVLFGLCHITIGYWLLQERHRLFAWRRFAGWCLPPRKRLARHASVQTCRANVAAQWAWLLFLL